ncbi:hypothetical protein B0H14DRAFT_2587978 [Mycena olivaceomarginata]|nr:hypothetical protein B0H14DRAFT_2587978 [Mycena olivaceomarginata]
MDRIRAEKKAEEKARRKQLAEKAANEAAERKAALKPRPLHRRRMRGNNSISKIISDYVDRHGSQHATGMFNYSAEAKDDFIPDVMTEIFQREGRAMQSILTRGSTTTVTELLKDFSMNQLEDEIKEAAPIL